MRFIFAPDCWSAGKINKAFMKKETKNHIRISCGRCVHCKNYEQREYSNTRLLSLAWKVSCDDCRHPSLGPATVVQGPCLDCWAWKHSPVLLSLQKPTEFKKCYHFYFRWGSGCQMGFSVGHMRSLSAPLAWSMLWQFDIFFYFFFLSHMDLNETNTVGSQNFGEPSPAPDLTETTSAM